MPTRTDITVVNQAYDTSGNGGRKLVRLSNGWLVASAYDSTGKNIFLYVDKQDGQGFRQLCYISPNNTTDPLAYHALVAKNNKIYVLYSLSTIGINLSIIDALSVTNTNQYNSSIIIDNLQSGFNGVSIAINKAGTELHATWASKNSTYPNSFNIRYAKGTINADGSVTWGSVEQVTKFDSSYHPEFAMNPCIILDSNSVPMIIVHQNNARLYGINSSSGDDKQITILKRSQELNRGNAYVDDNWSWKEVYYVGSYDQFSPSACVAPNGRIWVAWHGMDATDNARYNIRVAYSDNGGQTWSSMTKLTSGNTYNNWCPSLTINKNNEIFVLWQGNDTSDVYNDIRMIKYSSGSWSNISIVSTGTTNDKRYPSTLYDTTLNFSTPLFIYQDLQGNKVGFYGTWTTVTISVPQGYIGQKTSADKNNLLSYNITTDGTMRNITEKINGTVVNTRTSPTSGQQFTVSLTQEQWDAIKFGNGHTLTIEMNDEVLTYTFDKRLHANDDILSAVKGVQDLQTYLNGIKAQLGAAIRAKGGTVNDTDAWSAFVSAVANMSVKRWATGTTNATSNVFATYYNQTILTGSISVTGLAFKPKFVIMYKPNGSETPAIYIQGLSYQGVATADAWNGLHFYKISSEVTSTSFTLPFYNSSATNVVWIAFE